MYFVTSTFLTLTPTASLYYGFLGGSASAGIAAATGVFIFQSTRGINNDRLWRRAILELSRNDRVKSKVGYRLKAGSVKAYSTTQAGGLRFRPGNGGLKWEPNVVQMTFSVEGSGDHLYSEGLVVVVASKAFGLYDKIDFLSVTLLDEDATHIIVKGDESQVEIKDSVAKFVAFQNRNKKSGEKRREEKNRDRDRD